MDATLVAAALAALGSVAAAVMAGVYSSRAADARNRAERATKITARQEQFSEPLIEVLNKMFDQDRTGKQVSQRELEEAQSNFLLWVQIYGSDETLRSAHRWMQGSYYDAPMQVQMRLLMELVISLRRDLLGETNARYPVILGLRINDLYDGTLYRDSMLPLREYCHNEGWTPPWPPEMD